MNRPNDWRRGERGRGERWAGLLVALLALVVVAWGTQCAPVEASTSQDPIKFWADRVADASGVEARGARAAGDVVVLRIGAAEGPAVAVLAERDAEGLSARRAEQLVARAAKSEIDFQRSALVVITLPGEARRAVERASVDPWLNFPWRWDEARRLFGRRAGVVPGELPWVAGLCDALLEPTGITGVVDVRQRIDGGLDPVEDGPGTLRGLVRGRLGCELQVDPSGDAVLAALTELPTIEIDRCVWRRIGPRTWVADFRLRALSPAVEGRGRDEPLAMDLRVRTGDSGASLAAFAASKGRRGAVELVEVDRDRPRLGALDRSGERRCRAVLVQPEGTDRAPELWVDVTSPGALGGSERFAPEAAGDTERPSKGAQARGADGSTKGFSEGVDGGR